MNSFDAVGPHRQTDIEARDRLARSGCPRSRRAATASLRCCRTQSGATVGKTVIRSQDRAGFIVNALLVPYLLSAVRMVESGYASASDVDAGMVNGCAHPMGPLHLADLIGTDTVAAIATSMYSEFKEPLYAPPSLLLRMVEAGLFGRKSGQGFFDYKNA